MPSLELSEATTKSCKYVVKLSSPFNTNYYKKLRITSEKHNEEPIYKVDNYLVSITATKSTTPTSGIINTGMSAGKTYTLYAYALALNGIWYLAGSASITMKKNDPINYATYPCKVMLTTQKDIQPVIHTIGLGMIAAEILEDHIYTVHVMRWKL